MPLDARGTVAGALAGVTHPLLRLGVGTDPHRSGWPTLDLEGTGDADDVGVCGGHLQDAVSGTAHDQRRPVAAKSAPLHRPQHRDTELLAQRRLLGVAVRELPAQLLDRGPQPLDPGAERIPADTCLVELPLEMEVEILKRAAAYFARENVLPN